MRSSAFNGLRVPHGLRGLSPADYQALRERAQTDDEALAVLQDHLMSAGQAATPEDATSVAFPLLSVMAVRRALQVYLETALATSFDFEQAGSGALDTQFSTGDFPLDERTEALGEIAEFIRRNYLDIESVGRTSELIGYNFWLSRNAHGAGFFDRGSEPAWQRLQIAAQSEGSIDVYVGDDGKPHMT